MRGVMYIPTLARGAWLLLPFLSGCSMPSELGRPEWARVVLSAPAAVSLELLISQNFLVTEESVQLIDSTTDTVTVPFDERYSLGAPARFLVRARNVSQQTVSFRFKVFLEARSWMDEDKTLAPGEEAQFVYRYTEPTAY